MLTHVFVCSHILGLSLHIYCAGFKLVSYREKVTPAGGHLFANLQKNILPTFSPIQTQVPNDKIY